MQDTSKARKESAARAYESPQFSEALDEVLHPGGLELTSRVAEVAQIKSGSLVLDIASGRGTTACFLVQNYSCHVIGIDLSLTSASLAMNKADNEGLSAGADFITADAECFPFADSTFDTVISECSFSLLPDKKSGAREIARALKPGGNLVITDVFLKAQLSQELKTNVTFNSCFSGAERLEGYFQIFSDAGLEESYFEDHSIELKRIAYKLQIGYGSLEEFWAQFGSGTSPCCAGRENDMASAELWKRMFTEGKPGYGLFSFTKPQPTT
jgi:arsenite methyltransferase